MSNSFVIKKENLSKEQIVGIRNHWSFLGSKVEEYEKWVIEEDNTYICGYTENDCINMFCIFGFCLSIDNNIVKWGENSLNSIKLD